MIVFGPSFVGFLESIFWVFICILVFSPVWLFGPSLEMKFFPVISDAKLRIVQPEDGDTKFSYYQIAFEKNRECFPILNKWSWYVYDDQGYQEMIYFETPNNAKTWKVDNKRSNFKNQKLVVYYNCHPLWDTRTEIEFD